MYTFIIYKGNDILSPVLLVLIWLRLSGFYIIILVFLHKQMNLHGSAAWWYDSNVGREGSGCHFNMVHGSLWNFSLDFSRWALENFNTRAALWREAFRHQYFATIIEIPFDAAVYTKEGTHCFSCYTILLWSNLCRIKFVWVTILLIISLQMERSNLANHIQAFRQLVSVFLLQSIIFSIVTCFGTGSVQSGYLLGHRLQRPLNSLMLDNWFLHHTNGMCWCLNQPGAMIDDMSDCYLTLILNLSVRDFNIGARAIRSCSISLMVITTVLSTMLEHHLENISGWILC